jgi:hypothetical protein
MPARKITSEIQDQDVKTLVEDIYVPAEIVIITKVQLQEALKEAWDKGWDQGFKEAEEHPPNSDPVLTRSLAEVRNSVRLVHSKGPGK